MAAREVDGGVRVEVTVVETLRALPAVSVAVTDENGASAGPALKVLSIARPPARDVGDRAIRRRNARRVRGSLAAALQRAVVAQREAVVRDRFNKLDDFDETSLDLDARIGLRASESWKNGAIVQVYRVASDLDGITLSPDNHDTFTSLGAVTEYDTRDSWKEPSRGWWNSVDALWRMGTGDYATLNVDLRRYQPVATRQSIVATSLLTVQSGTRGVDVPSYADYALGGENTVRGWDFAARRGKNQFISTVEYRVTAVPTRSFRVFGINLYGGLAVAVFSDFGTAWDEPDGFSDGFIGGGGIGLRLFVPYVNMIRLDLSVGNGVHGQLGVNEKAVAQRNRVR